MTKNASKLSSEKPLLGAVICCTSIAPEQRSILAEYAESMGAEHKLDLTSDVTHLLVGSTDTPKYQYVAREREDVKVLRPEWVQAVREHWMEDRLLDMNALEAEYRVAAFAGLKICITGFDDLNARAEIASTVRKYGGEYTGDLTKDVTHLIAAEPVGKKFEYATLWQKKIVGLKWLYDTLQRGMQLDESKYHAAIPAAEQGIGAWNRQQRSNSLVGKRTRDTVPVAEPARKLRRTASSRLGSQTDNIWGDIVGQPNPEQETAVQRDVLRPSKSMPIIGQADKPHGHSNAPGIDTIQPRSDRCLADVRIYLHAFDSNKRSVVEGALAGLGAVVMDTISTLCEGGGASSGKSFIMVPHQCRQSEIPVSETSVFRPKVVTELWLEKCMTIKSFVPPHEYPLGGIINEIRPSEVASLVVNGTGFTSIETLHLAKTVRHLGARYDEVFTPNSTVLVWKTGTVNQVKTFHARQWNVPVVSEKWLWKLLQDGCVPIFTHYMISDEQESSNDLHQQFRRNRADDDQRDRKDNLHPAAPHDRGHRSSPMDTTNQVQTSSSHTGLVLDTDKGVPELAGRQRNGEILSSRGIAQSVPQVGIEPGHVLKEVSPNSPIGPPIHPDAAPVSKDVADIGLAPKIHTAIGIEPLPSPKKSYGDAETMNLAIQDLLNIKARVQSVPHTTNADARGPKKKQLLGRALSNLSNSSRTSQPRLSRASSIDSLNTDGVGSELAPPSGTSQVDGSSCVSRSVNVSLVGRARAASKPSLVHEVSTSIDIFDPNLCRDEYDETEIGPQLTQLGYEDSEEAVALREKLAERRRARARLGQKEGDPEPAVQGKERDGMRRRVIRDDEALVALEGHVGWGGGRRTRQRDKEAGRTNVF